MRAALLSPADIDAIRTAIRRQHPMQIQADPYEVGMLMLGRGGLRVSETAGLLAGDIRRSGAISVHATRLAALKSEAGRRKVPLSQLLEGEDLALWDRFCARRRRQVLSPDREPFLARPDLLDPEAFDVAELRALLAPLGFSPHDLRHTALSRLALVLYADEAATAVPDIGAILQRLTGWSPALQARIRRLFLGETRTAAGPATSCASLPATARPRRPSEAMSTPWICSSACSSGSLPRRAVSPTPAGSSA